MANQIADQFAHLAHDDAVAAVAQHLRSFWEPTMRAHLLRLVDRGAAGLDPPVVDAAAAFRVTA
jgi:formate dehydrogenase subunit delta